MTNNEQQYTIRSDALPEEFRILLAEYPREGWEAHPGFKDPTRNWLGAHRMFLRLAGIIRTDLESLLDRKISLETHMVRLSHYGDALVRNLHGHHHFEDTRYFPELRAADDRFAGGLEILERDHEILDGILHDFTDGANDLIVGFQNNIAPDMKYHGKLHQAVETVETLLSRHLADEEDLAVPIILHHRLRG